MSDKRTLTFDREPSGRGYLIMPAEADPEADQMVFTPKLRIVRDGKPIFGVFTRDELEAAYGDLDELRITIKESGGLVW